MALKKKKKTKKKKTKKVKKGSDDESEEKTPLDFPEYEDPDITTPRCDLKIQLASPMCTKLSKYFSFLTELTCRSTICSFDLFNLTIFLVCTVFKVNVMITTRVEEIRKMIIARHGGAIEDVKISLGSFDKGELLNPQLTLQEQGVVTEGEYQIVYDFSPVTHPLLTTEFKYTTVKY